MVDQKAALACPSPRDRPTLRVAVIIVASFIEGFRWRVQIGDSCLVARGGEISFSRAASDGDRGGGWPRRCSAGTPAGFSTAPLAAADRSGTLIIRGVCRHAREMARGALNLAGFERSDGLAAGKSARGGKMMRALVVEKLEANRDRP